MLHQNTHEIIIRPKSSWQIFDPFELWRYRELFYILIWRNIKVRYKQTAIGILWVLFQPLINMVIFTVLFGNFAKFPSGNLPYPVFVLIGLTYWGLFSTGISYAASSFIENESLVKKVYFPREILPITSVFTSFIDFCVSLFLLGAVFLFFHISITINFILFSFIGVIITLITSIGLGLFLASVNIKYRDVRYILPFFLQLLLFVTPIIYPVTAVRPWLRYVLFMNPMTGVIESLRSSLVPVNSLDILMFTISVFFSFFIFIFGLWYFRKTERFFADIL